MTELFLLLAKFDGVDVLGIVLIDFEKKDVDALYALLKNTAQVKKCLRTSQV